MNQILAISKDKEIFSELDLLLAKNNSKVTHVAIEIFDYNIYKIESFDFILIHLEFTEKMNNSLLSFVKSKARCPVYVFSKLSDDECKIRYMENGAEGCIEIPFSAPLTAARINSVIRYTKEVKSRIRQVHEFGRLTIDLDNRLIINDFIKSHLTTDEYKILHLLMESQDQVVSKESIINHVWDNHTSATDNALGIHITRLRKKLNCCDAFQVIETVWGLGYRFNYSLCESLAANLQN